MVPIANELKKSEEKTKLPYLEKSNPASILLHLYPEEEKSLIKYFHTQFGSRTAHGDFLKTP